MKIFDWFRNSAIGQTPRAATQSAGGGRVISTAHDLEQALSDSVNTGSGQAVTPNSSMRVAAVYACIRLRTSAVANLPLDIKRRVDDHTRENASDHPLWTIMKRKPNGWQTPSQFKRMLEAHLLLRGNAYALIVRSRDRVIQLLPLDPDRMVVSQNDDLSLKYEYAHRNGAKRMLKQADVFHLVGLTLDGVHGVSAITYARETIGLSLSMESHGAATFKNGARPSNVLIHPGKLGNEGREFLSASLDDYRSGGKSEGKTLVLEEGMDVKNISMTAEDAQWIESRKFSRTDIAMFFGVPPHMIGDTEKSTSWGTGIEQQSIGFVTYTLEESLTTWEETISRDLIADGEPEIYARFNRKALVRGDIKTRQQFYVSMLQWGVFSPNQVLELEDMNPREGGDIYYDPPNTAGGQPKEDPDDDPAQST